VGVNESTLGLADGVFVGKYDGISVSLFVLGESVFASLGNDDGMLNGEIDGKTWIVVEMNVGFWEGVEEI